jgi:Flp pilus assembly protein CpaB
MRAISIDVREVVTAGGNLQPGDEVDIVGVFEVNSLEAVQSLLAVFAPGHEVAIPLAPLSASLDESLRQLAFAPDDSDGEFAAPLTTAFNITITLSQDMKVLALSQTAVDEANGAESAFAGEPPEGETEPGAVTATLEVTPEQAQMLALANQYGALRLALRNFGDAGQAELTPVITLIDRSID